MRDATAIAVANNPAFIMQDGMPRRTTLIARKAKSELLRLISEHAPDAPLPTVRELGEKFDLHPSTMFRMLRDLAVEGLAWQSPAGRFFPAAARKNTLKGVPVCFVGREMWQWSRLYQELLKGISEVCSANGSPLILLSAPSLVRQSDPTHPPKFSSPQVQSAELGSLLETVPRGCAGFILDHLWTEAALSSCNFPGGELVQLLFGTGGLARVIAPDYQAGARLVGAHLVENGFKKALLIKPFEGDPAINAALQAIGNELKDFPLREILYHQVPKEIERLSSKGSTEATCLICTEDNTAVAAFSEMRKRASGVKNIGLIATQGTGVVVAPVTRLRYDYRRLGRSAAASILHGTRAGAIKPSLIR